MPAPGQHDILAAAEPAGARAPGLQQRQGGPAPQVYIRCSTASHGSAGLVCLGLGAARLRYEACTWWEASMLVAGVPPEVHAACEADRFHSGLMHALASLPGLVQPAHACWFDCGSTWRCHAEALLIKARASPPDPPIPALQSLSLRATASEV